MAIADDLIRCDWLGRVKLIITRAVRHLASVTLGMIVATPFKQIDRQVSNLDIYLFYVYGRDCIQCFDAVGWVAGKASGL